MAADYAEELLRIRALLIVASLQARRDLQARELIRDFSGSLEWRPLSQLMIDERAWEHVVDNLEYDPKLVFCHPNLLLAHRVTALYYRGLSTLSIKAAKRFLGSIEKIEAGSDRAKLSAEKALKMARTYNAFICSTISNSTDWTLENGYRTVIASLGITLDGIMRNKVGELAEQRVRGLVLEWLIGHGLVISPTLAEPPLPGNPLPSEVELAGGVKMEFRSEPDISFSRGDELLATVEIKGGTDANGALERYGAGKKSFEHAIAESPRCRNYYLSGVITDELRRRVDADRLVEKMFNIIELLESPAMREEFFRELFHHTLRLV